MLQWVSNDCGPLPGVLLGMCRSLCRLALAAESQSEAASINSLLYLAPCCAVGQTLIERQQTAGRCVKRSVLMTSPVGRVCISVGSSSGQSACDPVGGAAFGLVI